MYIRYIFNTYGEYVAFILNGYVFSPDSVWIGFIIDSQVFDLNGRYVGEILSDDRIVRNVNENNPDAMLPPRPMAPIKPLKPLKRLRMPALPYPYVDVFINEQYRFGIENGELTVVKDYSNLLGCKIYASNKIFLGTIEKNKYSKESVFNEYGSYGSRYSSTSIFNKYGQYGSPYSQLSAFNPYSISPPQIFRNDKCICLLTANKALRNRIDANEFVLWIESIKCKL